MSDLQFRRGLPARAIRTDLDVEDADGKKKRRPRRVLVYGALVVTTERALKARGAQLTIAKTAAEAVYHLATDDFDVVALDAQAPGGGLTLVKLLKLGVGVLDVDASVLALAQARTRDVPFVVLPLSGIEYAVILRPPDHAYLEDGTRLSVEEAILRVQRAMLPSA